LVALALQIMSPLVLVKGGDPVPYYPVEYEYTPGRWGGTFRTAGLSMTSSLIDNVVGGGGGPYFYNVLLCIDIGAAEGIAVYGDIAEWWEAIDNRIFTFYLVKNAYWWDGEPLTAHDVKYTFDYMIDKQIRAYSYILKEVESIEVLDDYILRITLKKTNAAFIPTLALFSNWDAYIMPKHIYEGEDWDGHPRSQIVHPDMANPDGKINPDGIIGSGPWIPIEFEPEQSLVMVPNDMYHHGRAYVDKYIVEAIPDDTVGLAAFKAGNLDYLLGLSYAPSYAELITLNETEGITVDKVNWNYDRSILFNMRKAPYDDLRVRKAIAMAIDRELVSEIGFAGLYVPDYHAAPPGFFWYRNDEARFPDYNPAAAEALLDEAGYPRGSDGWRFSASLMSEPYADSRTTAELATQQLREIGIDVQWDQYDYSTWLAKLNEPDYDMSIYWVNYAFDPNIYARYFTTGGDGNYMGYYNEEVDQLCADAVIPGTLEERLPYYYEVQAHLVEDIPWVPIINTQYFLMYHDDWHGLPGHPPDGSFGKMVTWMSGAWCAWNEAGSLEPRPIHVPWEEEPGPTPEVIIEYVDVPGPTTGITLPVLGIAAIVCLVIGFFASRYIK
jgi:peptide/nickel transport system substrate-binding protein